MVAGAARRSFEFCSFMIMMALQMKKQQSARMRTRRKRWRTSARTNEIIEVTLSTDAFVIAAAWCTSSSCATSVR